jgi:hypothetical protein
MAIKGWFVHATTEDAAPQPLSVRNRRPYHTSRMAAGVHVRCPCIHDPSRQMPSRATHEIDFRLVDFESIVV